MKPNIALMKLARWEVLQGNKVYIKCSNPEKIYVSNVFDKSKYQAIMDNGVEIIRGGRAENPLTCLPHHIEHLKPYYDLYGIDYSLGFTSRGCIRRCKFCDNWWREGPIRDHAPISEWHEADHKKVVILDNNFLASPKWKENLNYIHESLLEVNFHQGLDIRVVDDEKALWLSTTKIVNFTGTDNTIHFAFDDLQYKDELEKGVKVLKDHGVRPSRLCFYVIGGFWNQNINYDLERIRILKELGCVPYIMIYEKGASRLQHKLARWVNGTYAWRKGNFSDYKRLTTKERALVLEAEGGGVG